ncbi:MAG: gliding motility-associated ABC transporter substrate-binding protein GldG [Bacteroidetes bacterium]|nr:gliding motility-associated ABC transporter substrate-binding protein GldG [Bacteroidota bacterium]
MKRTKRLNDILTFIIGIIIILLANIIASQYFFRYDLTEDKRYSISPATIKVLKGLEDIVYVEVYLEGDFPAGFKRLQRVIRDKLDEFRIYAGSNLQFKFVNPGENPDPRQRNQYYLQLAEKGLQPTNLFAREGDKKIEKIIFPGALISYRDKEVPVMLLKGNSAARPDEILNQSVEGVEFELISAIRKLTSIQKKKIAIIEGHGELDKIQMADITSSLKENFLVERINLPEKISLNDYDAIIIARPDTVFSDYDKYKIDQFIIKGGKALFFIDAVNVNLDSIGEEGKLVMPYKLDLGDMFFRYGVRLNADLIQDLNSGVIPLFVGYMGNQPQTRLVNWRYYLLLNTFSKHPIVKNMDVLYAKFLGTIDTVKAKGIKKTPLIFTSKYSKILPAPVRVNFNEVRLDVNPRLFNKGSLPVAYLLEGSFQSLYTHRLALHTENTFTFKEKDKPSKIIICSDGDLIRNDVNKKTGHPYPLGYDRFTRRQFANKEFILNAVDYLLDESGIITLRAKEVTFRPLDKVKIKEERLKWQLINLVVPVVLIVLFGVGRNYFRKRKYKKKLTVSS